MALFRKPDYPTLGMCAVLLLGGLVLYHLCLGRKKNV